jgi:hypothetical protein
MNRLVGMLVYAVLPVAALMAGPVGKVFSRSPLYYVMHYGTAESSVDSERWSFLHPGTDGFTEVHGRFSTRRFHDEKVKIEAVFFRPGLALAAVTVARPEKWTQVDVDALLAEYGARWRQLGPEIWLSEEGVRAIHRDGSFHLLSPQIVGDMDKVRFGKR